MKKLFTLMLIIVMTLSLTACNNNTQTESNSSSIKMNEIKDVAVKDFEVKICGAKITNKDMEKYSLYSVESHTVNSQGTEHNYVFVGYKFSDVLEAAQISGDLGSAQIICTDGYEMTYEGDVKEDGVLLAITKDGETFKDGPWFAPCTSNTTGDFGQDLSKIEFGEITSPLANNDNETKDEEPQEEIAFPQDPISEDKTDKITFADFSFKINGKDVTNKDLEGLKIYRNTVVTKNSKDVVSQNKYSGYVLKDVLAKLEISGNKVTIIADDGYTSLLTQDLINNDLTIIAIEKDKETGKDGTVWLAPCAENQSGKYGKGIVEIVVE